MANYSSAISSGATQIGVSLSDQQLELLVQYLELFIKWNKAYNLSAIRDPEQMIPLHLLDSLIVHAYIQTANNIIDVGTGPGLPGVVLAIMNPEKKFTLLDSNGKKTRFLFQAKLALKLDNVTIVNERVEAYQPEQGFDMIISRAFASITDMTYWCKHLLAEKGIFLAMKGQYPTEEFAAVADKYKLIESHKLNVPGVDGERHLLAFKPI
ncbi:MAG: 16S rRNA (guanine527-N7)-methyltransferase [Oleispira sp.]|jgi:16S rRNA (guanine527-N7)-methyltransferase